MNFPAARLLLRRMFCPARTRALLALLLGALCAAPSAAQTALSPLLPTPYSWPGWHAGGASPLPFTATPSTGYLGTLTPPSPDALGGMLQGTPTGLVLGGTYDTQIPSFLLGNYDPTNPPSQPSLTSGPITPGGTNDTFPNHFADDISNFPSTINAFYAPFPALNQTLQAYGSASGNIVTVDDQSLAGFATTNGSVTQPGGTAVTFTWQTGIADGTAATRPVPSGTTPPPASYSRVPVATDANGNPLSLIRNQNGTLKYPADHFATATWTLTAPTAGSYTVNLNLPNPQDNATLATSEYRIRDAHYVIRDSLGTVLSDTRLSQQETNAPQFVAGPFPLSAGDAITVTLDNSTRIPITDATVPASPVQPASVTAAHTYVLADSVSLVPSGGAGDVQGSAAAVNATEYPEIANALYFGYQTTAKADPITGAITYSFADDNTTPYGNATIGTTPANATPATLAERRRIRQLVYFGRQESVVSQKANGELTAQPVGAIYCVDGNSGAVVWRYQTGGATVSQSTGYLASGLNGVVKSATGAGPQPFQIGPTAYTTAAHTTIADGTAALDNTNPGTFGTYTAFDATSPPFTPADTANLRFALYATTVTPVDATHVLYAGAFRIYPAGKTPDDPDILEHGTFSITATFTDGYHANLSGTLTPDPGPLQPAGYPYPVDFSHAPDTVKFTGLFQSDTMGNQSITNASIRAGITSTTAPPGGFVFTTPALARIHVLVGGTPAAPLYATKLVVVAADNLGYVYCLDAIGNRDGTSNSSVVDRFLNQPIYVPQPVFGAVAPPSVTDAGYTPHVGTTHQYWVYRPDRTKPKSAAGVLKTPDPDSDLPVPGSFGFASPAIDVQTRIIYNAADTTAQPAAAGGTTGIAPDGTHEVSSANIFIGNSNGTLYKLNALGTPLDNSLGDGTTAVKGDTFNASRDIRLVATDPVVPTPRAVWWLPTNLASTNGEEGTDSITSAPALRISQAGTATTNIHTQTEVYFTTANDGLNAGRLYRVDDKGATGAVNSAGAALTPGTANYNTNAQATWGFPRAYRTGNGTGQQIRPALGSIGGSPVLFTNPNGNATHVYIAANVRQEANRDSTGGTVVDDAPLNVGDAGRIWCVNLDGTFNTAQGAFAYPTARDPNNPANDLTANPIVPQQEPPIGGFVNATPAIGIVRFPAVVKYGPASTTYGHTVGGVDVKGQRVPMLYVGSVGTSDVLPRLYGIDLDGANDRERTIYADYSALPATTGTANFATDDDAINYAGLPSQAGFVSSPALVVNSTTVPATPGNGGALFITQTDNTLYQFQAAPVSNDTTATSGATGPDFGFYPVLTTAGPYSSPAVAAFDATDLNGTGVTTPTTVDFVYVGDSSTGEMIGLTPSTIANFGTNGGFDGVGGGGGAGGNGAFGPPTPPLANLNLQFPLRVYVFPSVNSTSTNVADAAAIGGPMPAFEWGTNVYIRVANVVPPDTTKPIVLDASGSTSTGTPGAAGSLYIVNGSPISVQISETNRLGVVDANRGSDVGQVPAVLLPSLAPAPPGNGIVPRTGTIETDALKDATGKAYLGAYTYAIGNGSGRKNTPGSQRRIITATQTAQLFRQAGATPNPATDTFVQTVTLTASARPAGSGRNVTTVDPVSGNKVTKKVYSQKVDQPTFAILNPLAIAAYGQPIASISAGNTSTPQPLGSILGPFRPVTPVAPTDTSDGTGFDGAAYTNGNRVYQSVAQLPSNGVLSGGGGRLRNLVNKQVLTTTDLIGHGLSGSNTDAAGDPLVNFADRSALGVTGRSLRVTMEGKALQWNDNSTTGTSGEGLNGAGAVINPLPWEDSPTGPPAGANHSLDYPDITSRAVRQNLQTQNNGTPTITDTAGTPDPATGTLAAVDTRIVSPNSLTAVNANHIRVQVNVPRFQPANTQLYQLTPGASPAIGTPVAPRAGIDNTKINFAMGYTAQMRVYVDSDNNHRYTNGEAYRELTTYSGVPIDMGTQITNGTIDLGVLTQGHGVQMPPLTPYDPYTAAFQTYFKPVTAFNTGNVNLLNVLFDQRLRNINTVAGTDSTTALPFGAGPLDGNAKLPAYDFAGVTGANAGGPIQPYILRTSLDPNFYTVAGKDPRNPTIIANAAFGPMTGATFHKARPGDAGPTTLTVPDVPHDASNPATLPSATVPTAGSTAPPYLSLEVPIGTPVGTYSQNVRLFEGLASFDGFAGPTYDPTVAGSYGGLIAPTAVPSALTFNNGTATQPYSSAAVVKTTVTEVRDTDGASAGTLPHIDAGPAGPTATSRADFGPAAFRNVYWTGGSPNSGAAFGGVNLYWTTARNAATGTPAYNVLGATLPYTVTGGYGFFQPSGTSWYSALTGLPFPDNTGLNTNVSVAPEQHAFNGANFNSSGNAYLFVQNTAALAGATGVPNYENRIYCLQINKATGQLIDALPDLTAGAAPAFGASKLVASSDPKIAKFGVKGLKIDANTSFADPLGGAAIQRDLWAFWGEGTRGRASLGYTSATTGANGTVNNDWMPTATLPLPQGIASASDPSAVLIDAPEQKTGNGNDVQALDISYTGVGADGNTDVYVSRYRPYKVRDAATGNAVAAGTVGLALSPFPANTQTLTADAQGLYWRARDTAWARDLATLDVAVNGTSLALVGKTPQFDRASGTLIYTGIAAGPPLTYPAAGTTTIMGVVDTVYVDLVRGRVRFRVTQTLTTGANTIKRVTSALPPDATATATFAPQARRITTDPRADSEPVTFLDEAFQPNLGASVSGSASGIPRVQANRAWYIWRKSGSAGTNTQPTLYYKTQRLSVVLTDGAGNPVSIQLTNVGTAAAPVYRPNVTVTLVAGGTVLYNGGAASVVDVDWARGRLYFPLVSGTQALEGQPISITYTPSGGTAQQLTAKPYWLDEPRYNDIKNLPTGTEAASTSETAVPLSTAVNEGTATAFLDPMAFADVQAGAYDPLGNNTNTTNADQPHKIWLYWSSTRNGTADIYSQAIEPRFAPLITANTTP